MINLTDFENKIGYKFKNKALLTEALTHTSYANEHGTKSFERLEFLGDSILGFVVAENLYTMYQNKDEGFLSKTRAGIVCEDSLSEIARSLGIPDVLLLGVGEEKSRGREKNSIISDVVEATIAAVYKDSDFETAKELINRIIPQDTYLKCGISDYKSTLQETFKQSKVSYDTIPFTDDDVNMFRSRVFLDGKCKGEGIGITKKAAEQRAAQHALEK